MDIDIDELVAAAKQGDAKAWRELAERLCVEIRPCFGGGFCGPEIDDLVQSTLFVILRKLPKYEVRPGKPFVRWARGIARIEAKKARHQRTRQQRLESDAARHTLLETNLSAQLAKKLSLELVRTALDGLDSPLRRVIENDLAGGDLDEFAKREGIKRDSVRVRRFRAYKLLRKFIRRQRLTRTKDDTPSRDT